MALELRITVIAEDRKLRSRYKTVPGIWAIIASLPDEDDASDPMAIFRIFCIYTGI